MCFDRPTNVNVLRPVLRCGLVMLGFWVACLATTLSAEEYFQLTGIATVVPPKRAFVLAGEPGQLLQPRTLVDGQVTTDGAVVSIDERAGCVRLKRKSGYQTLSFSRTNTYTAFAPDPRHRPIELSVDPLDANP